MAARTSTADDDSNGELIRVFRVEHNTHHPSISSRTVPENSRVWAQYMSHNLELGVKLPDHLVFDVNIKGDPYAFFHYMGFGFREEFWSLLFPVLGDHLETWSVRMQDQDRSLDWVMCRARVVLDDVLDEKKSDVRYMLLGERTLSGGVASGLVFKPGVLGAGMVFQVRHIPLSLLVTEDIVLALKAILKEHGLQRKLRFYDTAERAKFGFYT